MQHRQLFLSTSPVITCMLSLCEPGPSQRCRRCEKTSGRNWFKQDKRGWVISHPSFVCLTQANYISNRITFVSIPLGLPHPCPRSSDWCKSWLNAGNGLKKQISLNNSHSSLETIGKTAFQGENYVLSFNHIKLVLGPIRYGPFCPIQAKVVQYFQNQS